jgi:hypothetical protein
MNMNKKSRQQAIEELSLMLMYLTRFQDNNEFCRYMEISWRGYDFDALNELENKEKHRHENCWTNIRLQIRISLKNMNFAVLDRKRQIRQ